MNNKNSCVAILSQTWLLLVNVVFLGTAGVALFTGITMFQQSTSQIGSVDNRDIAIGLMAYGSFIGITAIMGCTGAIMKSPHVLTFFMAGLTIDLLILLGCGIYGILGLNSRKQNVVSASLSDWNQRHSTENDLVQQIFECCGFDSQDGSAYTGPSTDPNGQSIANPCAQPNTRPGCHQQVPVVFDYYIRILISVLAIGTVVSLISLWSAHKARKQKRAIAKGFANADKASAQRLLKA
ncbi:Tetraspanin/Peripherin [Gorgonomyces haynaldii]|nr:Tetraspanin/Peripherin [Gorgonomyces haynaldii]